MAYLLVLLLVGCASVPHSLPSIPAEEVVRLLPRDLKDRAGWAEDIIAAIEQTGRPVTVERACAVMAIIEQESGYQVDPIVRNLPEIVRQGLKKKFRKLGPMAGLAVNRILQMQVPGEKQTFGKRISKLKRESELDRFFRDIEAAVRRQHPFSMAIGSLVTKLMGKGWLEDFNPVTTAGSMQVKVTYAKELDGLDGRPDAEVRELLYTRRVGVRAGTARLLDYEAGYDDVIYRFADYNAGVYSSRNAAFQSVLSVVPDGDLLAYAPDGDPKDEMTSSLRAMIAFGEKRGISENEVRRAAREEKTRDFEDTAIWKAVRNRGTEPPYARVPQVTLESPKLSTRRSTEWFARNVKRRFEACRQRSGR